MNISLKNVFRNKGRSIYTIVGIALAISVVIAIESATNGLKLNITSMLANYRGDILVMEADALGVSNSLLPITLADRISTVSGVTHVEPYTLKHVFIGFGDLSEQRIRAMLKRVGDEELKTKTEQVEFKPPRVPLGVLGMRAESAVFDKYALITGEKRFSSNNANEIILGASLIKLLKRAVDKFYASDEVPARLKRVIRAKLKRDALGLPKLALAGETFVIRGAIKTGTLQDSQAIIPLETFQRLFDIEDSVHAFMIFTDKDASVDEITKHIRAFDQPKQLWADRPERMLDDFSDQVKDMKKLILATALLASLIGALSVLNTMASNVFERSKEIGLLLAVGWSKLMIVKLIFIEGIILATVGGILAMGFCILEINLIAWIVGTDPVPHGYEATILLKGLFIALAVGIVGSILPAWRAARLEPVEALRYE